MASYQYTKECIGIPTSWHKINLKANVSAKTTKYIEDLAQGHEFLAKAPEAQVTKKTGHHLKLKSESSMVAETFNPSS